MRHQYLIILVLIASVIGCKNKEGALSSNKTYEAQPTGMTFIDKGTFLTGSATDPLSNSTSEKQVSVPGFWMKTTEVTNLEYKSFTKWVRDSIARTLLSNVFEEFMITEDRKGNPVPPRLNWGPKIKWKDQEFMPILEEMYLPEEDRLNGLRELDSRKLIYVSERLDLRLAAMKSEIDPRTGRYSYSGKYVNEYGEEIEITGRSSFLIKEQTYIYPDTLVWLRDFPDSKSEPWAKHYFSHPGFNNHPVVGVNWSQSKAFCHWKSKMQSGEKSRGDIEGINHFEFRLPSEAEWEYAAMGGDKYAIYPWEGDSLTDKKGCIMANAKPRIGDYTSDGGSITKSVGSYKPNGYGLYDMGGNIAEWTESSFDESGNTTNSEFGPEHKSEVQKGDMSPFINRKIIRGGSWKDIPYFLRIKSKSYEYRDKTRCYIGFRYIRYSVRG